MDRVVGVIATGADSIPPSHEAVRSHRNGYGSRQEKVVPQPQAPSHPQIVEVTG